MLRLEILLKVFGADAIVDHLDTLGRNSYIFEKATGCSRNSNGTRSSHIAEQGITWANNNGMRCMYNGRDADLLGGQTCVQVSRVEMTVDNIWSFLSQDLAQLLYCFTVKKVFISGPGMDHLNILQGNIQRGKLSRQWTWTWANNFDVNSQ